MTAEIGVLNKYGVALAADSAVTIGSANNKILNSANKLFMLSKYHPLGIMVYQGASFMGVPWETLIKLYREELNERTFDKLRGNCEDFINYIKTSSYIDIETDDEIGLIVNHTTHLTEYLMTKENINDLGEEKYLSMLNNFCTELESACYISDFSEEDYTVLAQFKEVAVNNISINFKKWGLEFNKTTFEKAFECSILSLLKSFVIEDRKGYYSGIVIAGFGDNEIFPRLGHFQFYSKINGKLKYLEINFVEIGSKISSSINPFAQSEEVMTFINGISPKVQQNLESQLKETFSNLGGLSDAILKSNSGVPLSEEIIEKVNQKGEQLFTQLLEETAKQRRIEYINPVLTMLESLPKEDLGFMAETLVSLTSFKRRLSTDAETVGGPIDVAVITKGDGFIWLARKHYFNAKENQHFFNNYFKYRGGNDE